MGDLPERDAALLLDMLLAARDAQGFIEGLDNAAFLASRLHQNAAFDPWRFWARRRVGSRQPYRPPIPKSPGAKSRACATVSSTATERCVSILFGWCFATVSVRDSGTGGARSRRE
jgi:hypothetical protein